MKRVPPKEMAQKIVKKLKPQRPDYQYLKHLFFHIRRLLEVTPEKKENRLPELLTDEELQAFYEAIFSARNHKHMVMIKLLIFTGVRNAELANIRLMDVDLQSRRIRIQQGKGSKDRYVLIPQSFRGELWQYLESQRQKRAIYLFESNRLKPYSTRRIRQTPLRGTKQSVKQYAKQANIQKRVYPHLFRHQLITFLTQKGIISPKLQLLSGHSEEKSLQIYRDLALSDVAPEYQQAMKDFPIQ